MWVADPTGGGPSAPEKNLLEGKNCRAWRGEYWRQVILVRVSHVLILDERSSSRGREGVERACSGDEAGPVGTKSKTKL